MDHDRYGLDGHPIYPRPGHFDHVTGQPLPTFGGSKGRAAGPLSIALAVLMCIVAVLLAYMSNLIG